MLEGVGARVDVVRLVDHVIPPGVMPDMRDTGGRPDDFPDLYRTLVAPADIVVLATPIWLGDQSSQTRLAIERHGWSGEVNAAGQWSYYGKVGGVVVTSNEDGGKHCAAQMLYALSDIGFTIPPRSTPTGTARPVRGRRTSTTTVAPRTIGPRATPVRRVEHAAHGAQPQGRGRRSAHGNSTTTGTSPTPTTPTRSTG